MAYAAIEPWGAERDDVRALYAAQAAVAPYQKGGGQLDTRAYFPHLFGQGQPQTIEEQIEICKGLALAYGGEVR